MVSHKDIKIEFDLLASKSGLLAGSKKMVGLAVGC